MRKQFQSSSHRFRRVSGRCEKVNERNRIRYDRHALFVLASHAMRKMAGKILKVTFFWKLLQRNWMSLRFFVHFFYSSSIHIGSIAAAGHFKRFKPFKLSAEWQFFSYFVASRLATFPTSNTLRGFTRSPFSCFSSVQTGQRNSIKLKGLWKPRKRFSFEFFFSFPIFPWNFFSALISKPWQRPTGKHIPKQFSWMNFARKAKKMFCFHWEFWAFEMIYGERIQPTWLLLFFPLLAFFDIEKLRFLWHGRTLLEFWCAMKARWARVKVFSRRQFSACRIGLRWTTSSRCSDSIKWTFIDLLKYLWRFSSIDNHMSVDRAEYSGNVDFTVSRIARWKARRLILIIHSSDSFTRRVFSSSFLGEHEVNRKKSRRWSEVELNSLHFA